MEHEDMTPGGGIGGGTIDRSGGMTGRIRRILLEPKQEWAAIDAEPMTVKGIMTGWVVPLAAIGPIAGLIGAQVFGYGALGIVFRPPLMASIATAVTSYLLALVGVWVLSLIIDALAPSFGGTKNAVAAMKVAAFSATAGWLAGVFQIIPMLGFLAILGIYSLYLLYLGLPRLMRTPEDKGLVYTIVTIVAAIVLFAIIGAVTSAITWRATAPALASAGGTLSVAGVGSVDLGKINQAAQQMAAAGNQMAAAGNQVATAGVKGGVTPVAPAALAALLPTAIGGWTRTEIESSGGSAAGIGGSSATARYTQGSDTMSLEVSDIAAMGALASLGSAFNVQSNKQTDHGYERTTTVNGQMTTASWDGTSRHGDYSTIVGNRFTIKAEGNAPDDGQFKKAVDAVDAAKLAALAGH